MNSRAYLDCGFGILKSLREKTELIPDLTYGMSRPIEVPIDVRYFEEKLAKLTILFNDSSVLEKIESSKLLSEIPLSANIDEDWFDEIYRVVVDLAEFQGSGRQHFTINQNLYQTLREFPRIREENRLVAEQRRAEDVRNFTSPPV